MLKLTIIVAFIFCLSCSSNRNINKQLDAYKKAIAYLKFEQQIEDNFNISNKTIKPDFLLFSNYLCPYDMKSKLLLNDTIPTKNLLYLNKCRENLKKKEEDLYRKIQLSNNILFKKDQEIKNIVSFSEFRDNLLYIQFNAEGGITFGKYTMLAFLIFFDEDLEISHSLRVQNTVN